MSYDTNAENYNFIKSKISQLKESNPTLRNKSDDYVFSILCIKSDYYKNPALTFTETMMAETIVDGTCDGGVDGLLTDPNSEASDLVLVQSKFYQKITSDDVSNAISKMVMFYQNMESGRYENVNQKVIKRFLNLNAEIGDESKIIFVFYTSAKKGGIRTDRLRKDFENLIKHPNERFVLKVLYADEICNEIKEAESRRPTIENDKIIIDKADNYLEYLEDEACVVNVSAFCIKKLYGTHGLNLLSRNLRYHVAGNTIDRAIKDSIKNERDKFWFKNNGLTIICDNFSISGKEIHLKNFSVVNGGQTTYNLFRSNDLTCDTDFYLPCKIIKVSGNTEDDKNKFALEIAKATNSQKAIKQVDLKANSPEQIRFANTMRSNGIYYQTKRGESVPRDFAEYYKNTDLSEVGKLCLAAIFQLPATSRNKPSSLYNSEYYEPIFNDDQDKICKLAKELLYIDYYFKNRFLKKFDDDVANNPNANELTQFAHNARTVCIAFAAFASRYKSKNINTEDMKTIFSNIKEGSYGSDLYDIFKNITSIKTFFPIELFNNKDKFDEVLYKLFDVIIKSGRKCYSSDKNHDSSLNETNYLKKDISYYLILKTDWDTLSEKIDQIFNTF